MSAKKSDRPELPPQKPTSPIHWHGEPERVCGNCQHFELGKAMKNIGDCHNLISNRWQTKTGMAACDRGWYPCVVRFPLHKRFTP